MRLKTALTELFGIDHPVIAAPMGGITGGALAAAVSEAGGLGLIGGGYGDPTWLETELALARQRTDKPWGIGFITWAVAGRPELLDRCLAAGPAAVMLSFGDPAPLARRVKAAGCRLICQVQTVAGAREAIAAGADVIVAQGTEAGGHGGQRATFPLVPAVVGAVAPVPVVAAGGIADGRGLAAALCLGAAGALLGTRFYASEEALGHPRARERIVAASGDATVRTRVFDIVRGYDWPPHYTGRAIHNHFLEQWRAREEELARALPAEQARYFAAAREGDVGTAVVFAGEAIDLIDAVEPAGALVRRLVADAITTLRSATSAIVAD